jgi:hypothetical protein
MRCKHCGETAAGTHYCRKTGQTYNTETDSDNFILSAVIGAVTDSALLGGLIGGSFLGGIAGDVFGDGDLFD